MKGVGASFIHAKKSDGSIDPSPIASASLKRSLSRRTSRILSESAVTAILASWLVRPNRFATFEYTGPRGLQHSTWYARSQKRLPAIK